MGATVDENGVNFAIFSENATKVVLCLFDETGTHELQRIRLTEKNADGIWHGYVPGLKEGQVYGYRISGPFDPKNGHIFNPNKLLLDPHARETVGLVDWTEEQFHPYEDSAAVNVKARVTAPLPPVTTPRPNIVAGERVIYELHPKGFTINDPAIPEEIRGTYAALSHPATIAYFKEHGINSVELLPIFRKLTDGRLKHEGLQNYWGYNTLNYFTLEEEYGTREEFRAMVDALHEAGIEVLLDVVYNHTAEEGKGGPFLSFRGVDNASYYKLSPENKEYYINEAGCGNTLNIDHPQVRRMITDSLRYWVKEFGVDGFRFDLATILGRNHGKFDRNAPLFREIANDPELAGVVLVAEPWDPGGPQYDTYHLGGFPAGWLEWNGKYRDDVRDFWRGEPGMNGKFVKRLSGSSDEFNDHGRSPLDSVNMVTCHDGQPLNDVVSYNEKHNLDNKEGNCDGESHNRSYNYGVEGKTDNADIIRIREQQKRNMLATLFLAHGTPMLLAGDEFGNTQHGNNNTYCQDNEIGWTDKDKITDDGRALQEFQRKLAEFRAEHKVLTQPQFLHSEKTCEEGIPDQEWIASNGRPMTQMDWNHRENKSVGWMLNEGAMEGKTTGERLFMVFNASVNPISYKMPELAGNRQWTRVLDTTDPELDPDQQSAVKKYEIPARSVVVFRQPASNQA